MDNMSIDDFSAAQIYEILKANELLGRGAAHFYSGAFQECRNSKIAEALTMLFIKRLMSGDKEIELLELLVKKHL